MITLETLLLTQTKFAGTYAIDIELESWLIQILRDEDIGHAGSAAKFASEVESELVAGRDVGAGDLYVNGGSEPHVQGRFHEAARTEVGRELRQFLLHCLLHARHVLVAAGAVAGLEGDLHVRGVHGRIAGVDGRKAGVHADVRNDHAEILLGHGAADEGLQLYDVVLGLFQASAGGLLTRMTNWPASVEGKKARPRRGASSRLAAKIPANSARVEAGRATARLTDRS